MAPAPLRARRRSSAFNRRLISAITFTALPPVIAFSQSRWRRNYSYLGFNESCSSERRGGISIEVPQSIQTQCSALHRLSSGAALLKSPLTLCLRCLPLPSWVSPSLCRRTAPRRGRGPRPDGRLTREPEEQPGSKHDSPSVTGSLGEVP